MLFILKPITTQNIKPKETQFFSLNWFFYKSEEGTAVSLKMRHILAKLTLKSLKY